MKYDYAKGPEFYRACDHQAVQSVFVIESKKKADMKGPNDLFTIVATEPGAESSLRSCDELGHKA